MFIDRLVLTNFRNFRTLDLSLTEGPTIFVGDNAQGKSNLLEAICTLSTSRSPWATRDIEMVSWDTFGDDIPITRIKGEVKRDHKNVALEVIISGQSSGITTSQAVEPATNSIAMRKHLRVNSVPKRASDFIGQEAAVVFGPRETELVSDTPSMRRRFIDVALSQIDHRYTRALQKYNKVLVQRNSLLRRIQEGMSSPDELEFWDSSLVSSGAEVLAERLSAMERVSAIAAEVHHALTGGTEHLSACYQSNILGKETASGIGLRPDEISDFFMNGLIKAKSRDIRQGQTTVGPHRDDILVLIDGRPADLYASRGQQRTAALALKLAEARFMEERLGEQPVLLLDDVFSELDSHRRGYLMEVARGHQQVLVTTTDLDRLGESAIYLAAKYMVKNDAVSRI
ncbi:MAG: DNA replication/repair protein RecF [Dehalococcoidia bacterium]|nr:DNA replication/repair protein RecF [Dehalococcoidia bacterium]